MKKETLNRLYQLRINQTMEKEMAEAKLQDELWSTLLRDFIQSKINEFKAQKN